MGSCAALAAHVMLAMWHTCGACKPGSMDAEIVGCPSELIMGTR